MASGDTLAIFMPYDNEPPTATFATLATRNMHPTLVFADAVQSAAVFSSIMPQNYTNTTGITVILWWTAVPVTGNVAWLLSLERMDTATDLDADSFAGTTAAGVITVSATSGAPLSHSQAITKGANMDSVVAGDAYRLKIVRDAATDTAAGNIELMAVEVRET